MKKLTLIFFLAIVTISVAMAQIPQAPSGTADILGAHLLYGRGCVGCHAPHSGSQGNGVFPAKGDPYTGNFILWGEDLSPYYNVVVNFGGTGTSSTGSQNEYTVTLPADGTLTSTKDSATIVLLCVSCHDGNTAKVGMMKGKTVETLPVVGGNAPTLLGNNGANTPGDYLEDHPVGPSAVVSCGGTYNWDCTGGNTTAIVMNGPASSQFALNYGTPIFSAFATSGTTVTAVTCTTCHNQHSEIIYKGGMNCNTTLTSGTGACGTTTGFYQTMFFLRGYYQPNTGGNNAAQFCRQCHGGESNEMNGQMSVPTT